MGEFISFGEGEMPEELSNLLRGLLRKQMDTGLAHDPTEDDIMPSTDQLGLGPGDTVAITHGLVNADNEFQIARVVNPEEHAETYPDWGDRLHRSFILVLWFSKNNTEGKLGWVPRAKLIKLPEHRFQEMLGYMRTGALPDHEGEIQPPWLIITYLNALLGVAEANPDNMMYPIRCPECDSPGVLVTLTKTKTEVYGMGTKFEQKDAEWGSDVPMHVMAPFGEDDTVVCDLKCYNCGFEQRLPDEIEMFG